VAGAVPGGYRSASMRVAAITGFSGSGKSTLIVALIGRFRAQGLAVAAIKHTHHPLNLEDRGDTRRFRVAGADPVILVTAEGAAVHHGGEVSRIPWSTPDDLLGPCSGADIVLVEGFKALETPWPKLEIRADARPTVDEAAAELDRIWHQP
jgi:molybdopterin-guanine dinucleotide biosynthesis protein MobB